MDGGDASDENAEIFHNAVIDLILTKGVHSIICWIRMKIEPIKRPGEMPMSEILENGELSESITIADPKFGSYHLVLLAIFFAALLWSFINPYDRFTWWLEVFPSLIGIPLLAFTYKKFPFTRLVYALILAHAIILLIGGHYTYAREPFFGWLSRVFDWPRNNYDKLGHFAQGFVPAMIAREFLLRKSPLRRGAMLFFLVVCVCGALSAAYELFEWLVAVFSGSSANDFLGEQGYGWDTQTDMLMAFIGAISAQLFLSKLQDRQLLRLKNPE